MPLIDQIRADELLKLAHLRFDLSLSDAELKVLRDSASSDDLPETPKDAPRPEVRAGFLRWLASDPEAAPYIDAKGLRVHAATITGALDLQECHVRATLDFRRCTFGGEIDLPFAETRGILILDSSLAGGIAADGAIVRGSFFLKRVESEGEIRMLGAEIAGNLECSGATIRATGDALCVDGAKIGGSVYLNEGFASEGAIRLRGAEIKGSLNCDGAKLRANRIAIGADGARVGDSVFLQGGFESEGAIRLPGAQIGGNLWITGAKARVVDCQNTVIKGDLGWLHIEESSSAKLSLIGANVKNLRDDRMSWPKPGRLEINGLVYEELILHAPLSDRQIETRNYAAEIPLKAKERIAWIMLQPEKRRIEPQPWMQLRDLLKKKGDSKGAKYVLFRFRCLQAREKWILRQWWSIAFAWLEEDLVRICYLIALTILLGWSVFGPAGRAGAIAPTDPEAYKAFTSGGPMPSAYPALNTFIYTLENDLPLVKLGQDDKWAPDRRYISNSPLTKYEFLVWSRWLLILSGWFQASVLAAALSERLKK